MQVAVKPSAGTGPEPGADGRYRVPVLQARNVPFNLLIADHGARVFLIPQRFSQRIARGEVPEDVVATGVNPAVFEISGHLLAADVVEDYDACSQEAAQRMLEGASLAEEDLYDIVGHGAGG